jgi:transglutaminase-like putative cysteine protease
MSGETPTRRERDRFLLVNEVALAVVTMAAIVGMHRLFVDGSYWGALVVQALAAHVTVAALRRAGLRVLPAAFATAALGVVFITWTRFPDTARWLLPTPDTFGALGDDLSSAWRVFGDVRAPAPVENGFIAASAGAVWLLVFIADWAAFRVSATFEALLPGTTLFIFAAALGGPGSPVAGATVFSCASLLYVLLHRTASQERSSRWAGGRRVQGRWSLVGTGAVLVGVAVVGGAVAGPKLPGAGADPVVAWREINKDEPTRVVLSPIVQLETKLIEQPDVEVFNVRSERASYWRLTSLDSFDGQIWRSSYRTDDAQGELPRAYDQAASTSAVTQTITIEALSSVWLPAAFEPVAIDTGDQPTDFDERSSTLMVDRDVETSDGYTYEVTSQIVDWSDDELRTADEDAPDEVTGTYLDLPGDFPESAAALASDITEGQATPFDRALALQNYLRSEFTYDQTVGPGHSQDALLSFLFETRRGYCEQFAASFAALARSVDLPARVAIGFTQGINYPDDPTLYRVRGVHAHAWPEVFLGEYGWVPFEPTPQRGPPDAGNWLGIEPAQDTSRGGAAPSPDDESGSGEGGGGPADIGAAGDDQRSPEGGLGAEGSASAPTATDRSPGLPQPLRDAVRPLGALALAYAVVVPLAIAVQQLVRRRRASTPAARAQYLWRRAVDRASAVGVRLPPSMTIAEMADRMAHDMPSTADAIQALARTMEAIVYAETPPSPAEVARAREAWTGVVAESRRRRSWPRRALAYLDVRRLLAAPGERRTTHQAAELASPA